MQQYFVKGNAVSPVTIEDKETSKHMFQVMRLKEDDEVTLVFDDGIKRLARVLDVEARQFELVEELADKCGTASPSDHCIWLSQGGQAGVYHSKSDRTGC